MTATDTTIAALTDGPAKLAGLGYVIPPGGMNCGAGATGPMLIAPSATAMNNDANDDGDFLDAGDTLIWGSIPEDVADGYTELLTKYTTVFGAPGGTTGGTQRALNAAQKLLDETDPTLTALVEARTAARNTARDAHNKALAIFNTASQGPIYQAAVAEWNAKAAVTQSIADYNEQVTKTNAAQTALDTMEYSELHQYWRWNDGQSSHGDAGAFQVRAAREYRVVCRGHRGRHRRSPTAWGWLTKTSSSNTPTRT